MEPDSAAIPARERTLRCLVVDEDAAKRSFLAAAWANFKPGFDVLTAASEEAALGWLESARPDIIAIGVSIQPEPMARIVRAYGELCRDGRCCIIAELRPEETGYLTGFSPITVLQLQDPLDLEEVLRIGRAAVEALAETGTDADVVPLNNGYTLPDTEIGA